MQCWVGWTKTSISYTLSETVEHLTLTGAVIEDRGNIAANILTGNEKNNVLAGELGADTLYGGTGATAPFKLAKPRSGSNALRDFDFAAGDRIHVSAIDADVSAADDQAFAYVTGAFTGAGQVRAVTSSGKVTFLFSNDADTAEEMSIVAYTSAAPEAGWLLV